MKFSISIKGLGLILDEKEIKMGKEKTINQKKYLTVFEENFCSSIYSKRT